MSNKVTCFSQYSFLAFAYILRPFFNRKVYNGVTGSYLWKLPFWVNLGGSDGLGCLVVWLYTTTLKSCVLFPIWDAVNAAHSFLTRLPVETGQMFVAQHRAFAVKSNSFGVIISWSQDQGGYLEISSRAYRTGFRHLDLFYNLLSYVRLNLECLSLY